LRCLQLTREYMLTRQQFQQPLTQFQALRFNYANMLTRFQAARLMVYKAASSLDQKSPEKVMNCSMAKCFATDVAFEISNNAMQLHGGYGYLHDYEIERMFRDLRVHQILEGTNEIMQEIIARHAFADGFLLE
jgi:butyryl-CoA dehydrogenase